MASNTKTILISSIEIMLMSIGVLSIAILILNSVTYNIPSIYAMLCSWLRPPYIYFITNAIIITIVALSHLHHHHNNHHEQVAPPLVPLHHEHNHHDVISLTTDQLSPYGSVVSIKDVEVDEGVTSLVDNYEIKSCIPYYDEDDRDAVIKESINDDTKSMVVVQSTWTPPTKSPPFKGEQALEKVSLEMLSERLPVSQRFAHHRRPTKTNQAEVGNTLKVSKSNKHDTLENTWKAITERRHIPLTRSLMNSGTWELADRQIDLLDDSSNFPTSFMKSEPFRERTNNLSPRVASTKLKKEPSLSQDDLNRRVEEFINKFNEEMRLQRQQDWHNCGDD